MVVRLNYTKRDVVERLIEIVQEKHMQRDPRSCYMIDREKIYTASANESSVWFREVQSFDEFIIKWQDEQLWEEFGVKEGCDFNFEKEEKAV